jgi:hypothetical protein
MDWSGVLESSRQALSITVSISLIRPNFVNRFNSVGGYFAVSNVQID